MAALLKMLVVALACGSGARGEGGWAVPAVPAGRRAQFYLLKADGGYHYGYDTGAGHSAEATADAANEVAGRYAFVGGDGRPRQLAYTAGVAGFVPQLLGPAVEGDAEWRASSASGSVGTSAAAAASAATPFVDADANPNADASYAFSIDTASYQRSEAADARGNVRGRYAYNSPEGGSHAVSYVAGEGTGFVVTGSTSGAAPAPAPVRLYAAAPAPAPAAPAAPAAPSSDGSYSFSYTAEDHSRQESADASNNVRGSFSFKAPDDGKTRTVDYVAGSSTGFVAKGDHLPVGPEAPRAEAGVLSVAPPAPAPIRYSGPSSNAQVAANNDGSYSFSYTAGDHSRQEAADASNNVRGSYTYQADGKTRRVDYVAGAGTGFVALGDHLPSAASPAAPAPALYSPPVPAVPALYSAPAPAAPALYSAPAASVSQGAANTDGSYSFSYTAGDHSRQESADASNNVQGSYTFKASDDGQTRRVDYSAGAATGFVATGEHLPVAPAAPALVAYSAPADTAAKAQGAAKSDGSYSFSYNTGEASREESADADNNVRGSYTFRSGGQTRRVDYEAGAGTGFVARGEHLPKAPAVPADAPAAAPGAAYSFSYDAGAHRRQESSDGAGRAHGSYAWSAGDATAARPASADTASSGGRSYAYSYRTDASSKSESADADGNVRGEYSYTGPDGIARKVSYTSIGDAGFVVAGDTLPAPAAKAHSSAPSSAHSSAQSALVSRSGGAIVNQYLPPESSQKFGYVYDTKA